MHSFYFSYGNDMAAISFHNFSKKIEINNNNHCDISRKKDITSVPFTSSKLESLFTNTTTIIVP